MNYIVIDTETTNGFDDPMVYDCGWAVINDNGEVLKTRSYVVADIFIHEKELMKEAFFADKIPQYFKEIADGSRKLAWFENVRKMLKKDCKKYHVSAIMAHNMRFDYRSCTRTQRYLTKSKWRYFFPYGTEFHDILALSRHVLKKLDEYRNFCLENEYVTERKVNRYTAEIVARYFFDKDFIEEHTALADCEIEYKILLECLKMDSDFETKMW